MPTLSLTQLVDIVCKSGIPKVNSVKNAKAQLADPYDPRFDFYKILREGIVEAHARGLGKTHLADVISDVSDPKRLNVYPGVAAAYRAWWGRKTLTWFRPPQHDWQATPTFAVSVNPELGLSINGDRHVIKLYFKEQSLTKNRIELITHLMHQELSGRISNAKFSVLDVRQKKLHTIVPPSSLGPAVAAEIAYIEALWPNI